MPNEANVEFVSRQQVVSPRLRAKKQVCEPQQRLSFSATLTLLRTRGCHEFFAVGLIVKKAATSFFNWANQRTPCWQ